jgi:hypothetical protein
MEGGFSEGHIRDAALPAPIGAEDGLFPHPTGSLLSMVESRVLMVVEVLRHDQTLTP